jgi:hypothetical protein
MNLPNLLVIGAMKCGTTSLHHYLNQHPDIFMSKKKELDFFVEEKNWSKGVNWYREQFPEPKMIRGESSQNYSKAHMFHGVPERIKSVLKGEVRFLYITRDPLDRIVSHYIENLEANELEGELNQVLLKNGNKYLETSLYGKQLHRFMEVFGKNKNTIKVITLEKLQKDKQEVMNEIFEFLGVSQIASNLNFDQSLNARGDKEIKKPVYHFAGKISRLGLGRVFGRRIKDKIKSHRALIKRVPDIKVHAKTIEHLKVPINTDLDMLSELTGTDYSYYRL